MVFSFKLHFSYNNLTSLYENTNIYKYVVKHMQYTSIMSMLYKIHIRVSEQKLSKGEEKQQSDDVNSNLSWVGRTHAVFVILYEWFLQLFLQSHTLVIHAVEFELCDVISLGECYWHIS